MTDLYNVIGNKTYENLLADPQGADAIGVPIDPNCSGVLAKGCVIYRDTTTGLWSLDEGVVDLETNVFTLRDNEVAVLAETVEEESGEPRDAKAYRTGIFKRDAVTFNGAPVTMAQAALLRKQGIVLDMPMSNEAFDNDPS